MVDTAPDAVVEESTGRPSRAAKSAATSLLARSFTTPAPREEEEDPQPDEETNQPRTKRQRLNKNDTAATNAVTTSAPRSSAAATIANKFTLRVNSYVHTCRINFKPDDLSQICQCKRPTASDQLTCDEECINAQLKTECSPQCPMRDQCGNQRFARRQYAPVTVKFVGAKGHGLFTTQPIRAGQFIIEYVGEVLDESMCAERIQEYRNSNHFYLLTLTQHMTIDATQKGNWSRFINHSCSPNAATQKWDVGGYFCVGIFAKVDIPAGSEITFDYQYERYGGVRQECLCGSSNCAGFLGGKPRRPEAAECTCANENVASLSCPQHGAAAAAALEDDEDSVVAEERKTGELIDAVTLSTRRIFRPNIIKPHTADSAATAATNSAVPVAPLARPYESFPRALRRGATARVMQLLHLLSAAQTSLLPSRQWRGGTAATKPTPPLELPFLHHLLDGGLPQVRTSEYFRTDGTIRKQSDDDNDTAAHATAARKRQRRERVH